MTRWQLNQLRIAYISYTFTKVFANKQLPTIVVGIIHESRFFSSHDTELVSYIYIHSFLKPENCTKIGRLHGKELNFPPKRRKKPLGTLRCHRLNAWNFCIASSASNFLIYIWPNAGLHLGFSRGFLSQWLTDTPTEKKHRWWFQNEKKKTLVNVHRVGRFNPSFSRYVRVAWEKYSPIFGVNIDRQINNEKEKPTWNHPKKGGTPMNTI